MRKHLAVAATLAILSPVANAQSPDSGSGMFDFKDLHGTVGVRFWRTDWSTWFGVTRPQYVNADLETTVTPVASVRYKDFLVSGSYLLRKDFKFPFPNYPPTERREYDLNVGYFLLPGLAASIGYKNVKYDTVDSSYIWNAKGVTVGLSGSAPLGPWTSLYGNLAYGRPKLQDNAIFNSVRAKYLLTELGLAFPLGQLSESMSGVVVTTGYRYQRIGAVPNVAGVFGGELFEYTQGAVIGITYSR